jgi:hypothetical protein
MTHNLDIYSYSFPDILDLFHLSPNFGENDLKRAKLIALKTHPDKSGLPPQYFLFYKKAFDIVLDYYKNNQKTTVKVPDVNPVYSTGQCPIKSVKNSINNSILESSKNVDKNTKKFNDRFNELYEKNMVKPVNSERNQWFKDETPVFQNINIENKSVAGIHSAIDQIKERSAAVSLYRGVQELVLPSSCTSFYDEDEAEDGQYITTDPFSKLKFDDLRKVHKDQTVLAVSERDFSKIQTYGSVDAIKASRGQQMLTPMEKQEAERVLREKEYQKQKLMEQRQHSANLQTMRYEEKNSMVLAEFLRLGN